uniref:BAG protein n=1 Tax=Fragaria vesca TaxID=57918 RepID=V9IQN8_FRAVE|nr:BAG protein [Fragaria vesca]
MESFFDTPCTTATHPTLNIKPQSNTPIIHSETDKSQFSPNRPGLQRWSTIPVQYAAPERRRYDLRSDAALKIQKAFRGYLVRKSVTKIAGINREVDEISERVAKKETADLVRTDAKERLKVVETLMSLLLKLDSVKGVDSGVRDLRRSVIKKAIALQEKVEASAANHQTGGGHESAEPVTDSGLECSEESAETGVNERESSCNSRESKNGAEMLDKMVKENSRESKNGEEMLDKMVKENQRMVGLMTELVHRNEKQTRLLGSLSQRVEMLERALINERLRRKKRRQSLDCREDFF